MELGVGGIDGAGRAGMGGAGGVGREVGWRGKRDGGEGWVELGGWWNG